MSRRVRLTPMLHGGYVGLTVRGAVSMTARPSDVLSALDAQVLLASLALAEWDAMADFDIRR